MKKWFLRGLTLGLVAVLPVLSDARAGDGVADQSVKHHHGSTGGKKKGGHHHKKGKHAGKPAGQSALGSPQVSPSQV
jgi:hypothetical protein